uniref:Uncharacterized protein n=1 Tax=Oryza rufipogon TaxID=4529 RepID=A0A0E0PMN7_ORYRU
MWAKDVSLSSIFFSCPLPACAFSPRRSLASAAPAAAAVWITCARRLRFTMQRGRKNGATPEGDVQQPGRVQGARQGSLRYLGPRRWPEPVDGVDALPGTRPRAAARQGGPAAWRRNGADEGAARRGGAGVEEPAEEEGCGDGARGGAGLDGERRSRHHAERVNAKLGKALADAERELEREWRSRERLEKVCDELVRGGLTGGVDGNRGGKEEVEEMRREAERAQEELEKEREMLRLADELRHRGLPTRGAAHRHTKAMNCGDQLRRSSTGAYSHLSFSLRFP